MRHEVYYFRQLPLICLQLDEAIVKGEGVARGGEKKLRTASSLTKDRRFENKIKKWRGRGQRKLSSQPPSH